MTWLLTTIVAPDSARRAEDGPQLGAQQRVEPHRRLVEHEQLGRSEHGDGERHPALLAAAQRVDGLPRLVAEAHLLDDPVDVRLRARR